MSKLMISPEEYQAVLAAMKENQDKKIDRRLNVIKLRYEGLSDKEIAKVTEYHPKRIGQICKEFDEKGLAEFTRKKYGGNHRAMSYEEEEEIIRQVEEKAEAGQVVTAKELKAAFDERRGKDTGRGYIYMLLARHGYRKVMPRPRHPKAATEEEINSSKKLTIS